MKSNDLRHPIVAVIVLAALLSSVASAQQAPLGPPPTSEELQTYETFRAWLGQQPADVQQADDGVVFARYGAELRRLGKTDKEIGTITASLRGIGDRAEIARWNRLLTSGDGIFSKAPNAFLVTLTKGMKPGRSLDVGMGQGRNTIYLAQQGWESHGFDPADRAVAAAQDEARKLGVRITTTVARAESFDWGDGRWDLIVLSYVGAREFAADVARALRPGGLVIVEGFHRDVTKKRPVGGSVVFDTNELLQIFKGFRVVRYEDTEGTADFGLDTTRVVRLAAMKPGP